MKVRTVTNVEVSSLCNRSCDYCPAPDVHKHRYAGVMSQDVFEATMEWVNHFAKDGTQGQLNLFGVGEPLLNKNIVSFVRKAREAMPMFGHIRINTNGKLLTPELADDLKEAGITDIHVTDHDARVTVRALRILRDAGIHHMTNRDFVNGANNWAGQIDWTPQIDYKLKCPWINRGEVMVMADGDVTRCCLDAFGEGVIGNVLIDDVSEMNVTRFSLCEPCHHTI